MIRAPEATHAEHHPPLVGPYDGKMCEWCLAEDHGRCWRVVCKCQHEGWIRDPNAQVPHGMSAGGSKDVKDYSKKRGGGSKKKEGKNASYRRPGIDDLWPT